jgi:hypothetical protein
MKTKEENFIKIPLTFLQRKDVTPATKLVFGYILTRSNINETDWEINASDITKHTGLCKMSLTRILRDLLYNGYLTFVRKETYKKGGYPTKVYSIVRDTKGKMKSLDLYSPMTNCNETDPKEAINGNKKLPSPVTKSYYDSNNKLPSPVSKCYLEEDKKEKELKEDKKKEEERSAPVVTESVIKETPHLEIPDSFKIAIANAEAKKLEKEKSKYLETLSRNGNKEAAKQLFDSIFYKKN